MTGKAVDVLMQQEETDTQKATRLFLTQVRQLPGVLRVEQSGDHVSGDRSAVVYLQEGDMDTEYRVYALKGHLYRRYPDACLNVDIAEDVDIVDESDSPVGV